jgi:hypothetical protein
MTRFPIICNGLLLMVGNVIGFAVCRLIALYIFVFFVLLVGSRELQSSHCPLSAQFL